MKRSMYSTIDFVMTAIFAIVIMPMLGLTLLLSVPAFRLLRLMNAVRNKLASTMRGKDA